MLPRKIIVDVSEAGGDARSSQSPEQDQDQDDHNHQTQAPAPIISRPVERSSPDAGKAPKERDDQNDKQNRSKRHDRTSLAHGNASCLPGAPLA